MKPLSKYQETAKRILAFPLINLRMYTYCSLSNPTDKSRHECGTSYCAVGYLAYEDNYPEEFWGDYKDFENFKHTEYSEELTGVDSQSNEWQFLFAEDWPDEQDSLNLRAQHALEFNKAPPRSQWHIFQKALSEEYFNEKFEINC